MKCRIGDLIVPFPSEDAEPNSNPLQIAAKDSYRDPEPNHFYERSRKYRPIHAVNQHTQNPTLIPFHNDVERD